jgi:hypothetical protein
VLVLAAASAGTGACTPDPGDVGVFTSDSTATGTVDGDGSASDGDTTAADSGPILDSPGGTATGEGGSCDPATDPTCLGCTAVDVLFVIDNSGTMCTKQAALAAAFPGFVDAMFDSLPAGTDLHVGVTTSGFELGGSHSESNCVAQEPLATIEQYYVRPTEGTVTGNGLQGRLYSQDGMFYYAVDTGDPSAKQGLKDWFTAAATGVGCAVSSFEFNASGAAWALHPANDPTNAGFLRDGGAALLLFILTDEGDQSLDVESMQWLHDTVVSAKSECGESCIIPGGLLPQICPMPGGGSGAFLESFVNTPITGDIGFGFGMPDYAETVGDALATVVAQTCETIPPVD